MSSAKKKKNELPQNLADLVIFRFRDSGLYTKEADFDFRLVLDACTQLKVFDISGCDCTKKGHQAFLNDAHRFVIGSKTIVEFRAVDCKFRKTDLSNIKEMILDGIITKIDFSYISFIGKEKTSEKDGFLDKLFHDMMNNPRMTDAKLVDFGFSDIKDHRSILDLQSTSLTRLDISGNNYYIDVQFLAGLYGNRRLIYLETKSNRNEDAIKAANMIVENNRTLQTCMFLSLMRDYDMDCLISNNIQSHILKEIETISLGALTHKDHGSVFVINGMRVCMKCCLQNSPKSAIEYIEKRHYDYPRKSHITVENFRDGIKVYHYSESEKHKKKVELREKAGNYIMYVVGRGSQRQIIKGIHNFVAWNDNKDAVFIRISNVWLYPFAIPNN